MGGSDGSGWLGLGTPSRRETTGKHRRCLADNTRLQE